MSNPHEPWDKHKALVGRTIVAVEKMTDAEVEEWGVDAIVLELDDGSRWWLSADSEGNRGGDIHRTNFCRVSTNEVKHGDNS
jgi:hypothetical protein